MRASMDIETFRNFSSADNMTRFVTNVDTLDEPMNGFELDTEWSSFLPETSKELTEATLDGERKRYGKCRDSLSRWARDCKPGDTFLVGKIIITAVE
jgi:hypothetical protein